MKEAERQLEAKRGEPAKHADTPALDQLGDRRLERDLTERLKRWRELLSGAPQEAREVLRVLIPADSPILFVPEEGGFKLRGATKLGALFEAGEKNALPLAAHRWRPKGDEDGHWTEVIRLEPD